MDVCARWVFDMGVVRDGCLRWVLPSQSAADEDESVTYSGREDGGISGGVGLRSLDSDISSCTMKDA
jgi:hypothetical protein